MIFDPPARRRPFLRILLPLLLIVAVVIAVLVAASGDETRAELEYVENVQKHAAEMAKSGHALRQVVSRLQRIDRTEFGTAIDGIRADLTEGEPLVVDELPSEAVLAVRAMYGQALDAWGRGVAGFEEAVLAAADNPDDMSVVDSMAAALAELRAGDSLYADLVAAMGTEGIPASLTPMPEVSLTPGNGTLVSLSVFYIASARSANNELALRPGLAVSMLVSDPEWQVNTDDQVVVPETETLSFSVVITNAGNVASQEETLLLTLIGGPEEVSVDLPIPPLGPDQQLTLEFDPVSVAAGGIYQVTAELVLAGQDADLTDNEIAVEFLVNG